MELTASSNLSSSSSAAATNINCNLQLGAATIIGGKRKRQQQDSQDHQQVATHQPSIDYDQLPLCSGRWLTNNTPLTVEQLRDQVRKRKCHEDNRGMRKRLRITGTKSQLIDQLRSYDKAKMESIKTQVNDWDLHQCLEHLIRCLRHQKDHYYVVPLLRRIRKLLQVYHADLYAGDIKEQLDIDMIGMNLFKEACFCNLDYIMSCPQINKILYQDQLIAPAVIARNIKDNERQIAIQHHQMTPLQAQQLASIEDLAVASDQSISSYGLFPTAILTRIARDISKKYDSDRALKRIIQLSNNPSVRESCGIALSEAVSRVCNCYQLKDKLLQYGILDCAAINFKNDPMCSQHIAQFMDSLNCSDWRQQTCDTLINVLENFVVPAIEGHHNHVLDVDFTDQAFCVAHRLFSSLQQPHILSTIMEKISHKYPILSYMKGQLDDNDQTLRGIALGNAIVEHLENWSTLSHNDPMKLKHRWLTYSDTIKNGLSAELFIRLSQISPAKKQDIETNDQDNQSS